jgi:hypothetical protein
MLSYQQFASPLWSKGYGMCKADKVAANDAICQQRHFFGFVPLNMQPLWKLTSVSFLV